MTTETTAPGLDAPGSTLPRRVRRLPVIKTMVLAFRTLWSARRALFKAGLIAAAVTFGLTMLEQSIEAYVWKQVAMTWDGQSALFIYGSAGIPILFGFLSLAVYSVFAVKWHRHLLLAEPVGSLALPFSARCFRFWVWGVVLAVLLGVLTGPIFLALSRFATSSPLVRGHEVLVFLFTRLVEVPALYFVGRFSLVFPAIAIDRAQGLRAWRSARGNGWRLVVVTALIPLLVRTIKVLVPRASNAVSVAQTVLDWLLMFVFIAYEVTALSLSYRYLVREKRVDLGPAF